MRGQRIPFFLFFLPLIISSEQIKTFNIALKNSFSLSTHLKRVQTDFPSISLIRVHWNLAQLKYLGYSAHFPASDVEHFKEAFQEEVKIFEEVSLVQAAAGQETNERLPYTPAFSRLDESGYKITSNGFCVIGRDAYLEAREHRKQSDSSFVNIFVLDTAIENHDDLTGRLEKSNFSLSSSIHSEDESSKPIKLLHGSRIASLIGGDHNGINLNTHFIEVQVLNQNGEGRSDDVIAALDYVIGYTIPKYYYISLTSDCLSGHINISSRDIGKIEKKVRNIVTMAFTGDSSLALKHALYAASGGKATHQVLPALLNLMIAVDVLVVAAAGDNDSYSCHATPAQSPHVLIAAASSEHDLPLLGCNYGDCIDIYAPGKATVHEFNNGASASSFNMVGSSVSTAIVAGFASLFFTALLKDKSSLDLLEKVLNQDDVSAFLRNCIVYNDRTILIESHVDTWSECSIASDGNILEKYYFSLRRLEESLAPNDPTKPRAFNTLKRNFAAFNKRRNSKKYEE